MDGCVASRCEAMRRHKQPCRPSRAARRGRTHRSVIDGEDDDGFGDALDDRRFRWDRRARTAAATTRVRLLREAYEKLPIREVVDDVSRALEVRR